MKFFSFLFIVIFSAIEWSSLQAFRWHRDSNPRPRIMTRNVRHRHLPLDQGASLIKLNLILNYFICLFVSSEHVVRSGLKWMEIMPIKMSSLLSLKKRGKRILNIWNEYFTLSVETNKQQQRKKCLVKRSLKNLNFVLSLSLSFFVCLF